MIKVNVKALVPLKKNISVVAEQAKSLEIADKKDLVTATEMLSVLNKYSDSVKEKKEKVTKPLNEALREVRTMFKPFEDLCGDAVTLIRSKMGAYQTEQVRLQREEEARIAARVKPGTGNLSVETAVAKMEKLEKPVDNIATTEGDVKFRESKILKIVNATLIPREYLVPDEKKILADLKAGKAVAGCEIELISVPVNYR